MNKKVLLQLKNNPFYKMTDAQKRELEQLEEKDKKPMIEFGMPKINKNPVPKQAIVIPRRKRK